MGASLGKAARDPRETLVDWRNTYNLVPFYKLGVSGAVNHPYHEMRYAADIHSMFNPLQYGVLQNTAPLLTIRRVDRLDPAFQHDLIEQGRM